MELKAAYDAFMRSRQAIACTKAFTPVGALLRH